MNKSPRIFLSYGKEDKDRVKELYYFLKNSGMDPWLDEEDILPGQIWDIEIRKAISNSEYFIVCLSKASVSRRGFFHKEIKIALDVFDEMPEGKIFLIPVRLEECEVPFRLSKNQWVDLFDFDEIGLQKLLKVFSMEDNYSYPLTIQIPILLNISKVAKEIFDYLYLKKDVTIRELQEYLGYDYNKLHEQLTNLMDLDIIKKYSISDKQPRIYYLSDKGLLISRILKEKE